MAERDPVLVANTREWLERAKEDLETGAFSLTADPPFVRSALFHCQQAVEKAMKAFLTAGEANEALRLARSFMASMLSRYPRDIVSDAGFAGDVPPSAK